ncbi:DUF4352 domain-containing protein [Senegalia massiliensis]|nr:DUF4352 domain-containing protein [Senegalia massiliensis]
MLNVKIFKKYLFIGILLVTMGLLGACGEDTNSEDNSSKESSTENNETNENQEDSNDENESKKSEDKVYKVGDTVKVGNVELTVNSASFSEPAEYSESKNGKVLTLDVTAKNTGDDQVFIDNTEFAIYDNNGNKQDDYYGYDDMAISEQINSGKQVQGKVYFDVVNQDSYEMIYTPSFSWDSKEYIFEIIPK